ncbi:MAG: recombinase family protein [Mesorhizobium sp.]|nr:recombinase family protein [Mesorhizobium sp.]
MRNNGASSTSTSNANPVARHSVGSASPGAITSRSSQPRLRCAVYTRKSTEEGLDQEFNSLDAQREACAAYITSQVGLGWKLVPDHYDDGGISGGTMERPALLRLLQDIRDKRVDVVVVYKIDRLTRSLADFAKIVEVFDGNGVSFVSVTQQFNTTTSMGRLTLNVLLSFAQFEREVTAERIRDKIAASRKKGMWMGGTVPLGYRVQDRKLLVNESEASFVRSLFNRYLDLKSVPKLAAQVSREAAATPSSRYHARPMASGMLYKLLANPLYIGKVRHRGEVYDGEHQGIIDVDLFDAVQKQLAEGAPVPKGTAMRRDSHLLTGILFDDAGDRMAPTHGKANGRRYRYYVSGRVRRSPDTVPDSWRMPASEIERVVRNQASAILRDRGLIAGWVEQYASPDRILVGLDRAAGLALSLSEHEDADSQRSVIQLVFRSITVSTSAIRFEVNAWAIVWRLVDGEIHTINQAKSIDDADDMRRTDTPNAVTIELPVLLRRRGTGMRIVIDSPYAQPEQVASLVDLIARAHVYLDRLTGPTPMTTSSIASTFGVDRADVGRVLPLAFLSPATLDAILTGRQSTSLTARRLARDDIPNLWVDQEAAFRKRP